MIKVKSKLLITVLAVLITAFCASVYFYMHNLNVITYSVSFFDVDISRLSKKGLEKTVDANFNDKIAEAIIVRINSKEYEVNIKEIGFSYNKDEIYSKAMAYHHSLLPFSKGAVQKKSFEVQISYDEKKLDERLSQIEKESQIGLLDQKYEIKNDSLVIYEGENGLSVNVNELKETVIKNIQGQNFKDIDAPVIKTDCKKLDLDEVKKNVKVEPKDAYLAKENNVTILKEAVTGTDFDMAALKKIMETPAKSYTVKLTHTTPSVKADAIKESGFTYLLSSVYSEFTTNSNRTTNIKLAAQAMNDKVVNPGETFSFNSVVGDTTAEKGYKEATVYTSAGTEQGLGGGICQVSSTLYNACLYANVDIVSRSNHSYTVTYLPPARDAAISYPNQDFKFKNNYDFPIKIFTKVSGNRITVEFHATQPVNLKVELESVTLSTTKYTTVRKETNTLKKGKTKTDTSGHNGMVAELYKVVTIDGVAGPRVLVNKSTYRPLNTLILVGTG